jgi:hypothetical protein
MNKPSLAQRRAQLIAQCAEQRAGLADAVLALRPSNAIGHPVAGFVVGNKKLVLGAAATSLALMLAKRKRLAKLAGLLMSGAGMARNVLGVVRQFRR